MKSRSLLTVAAVATLAISLQSVVLGQTKKKAHPKKKAPVAVAVSYEKVQKVLTARCVMCHGENRPRAGIDLRNYASVMRGGEHGPIVKAGDPKASLLSNAVHGANGARKMPPPRFGSLPAEDLNLIDAWIKAGAKEK